MADLYWDRAYFNHRIFKIKRSSLQKWAFLSHNLRLKMSMFKLKSQKYRKCDIIEYRLRYQIMKLVHGYGLLHVWYEEFVKNAFSRTFKSWELVFNLTSKLSAILLSSIRIIRPYIYPHFETIKCKRFRNHYLTKVLASTLVLYMCVMNLIEKPDLVS